MADYPIIFSAPMVLALLAGRKTQTRRLAWRAGDPYASKGLPSLWQRVKPGDRLWVREGWRWNVDFPTICYRADYDDGDDPPVPDYDYRWRSPIHLKREHSRITLLTAATKIEPLRDIGDRDAEAEGVVFETADPPFYYVPGIHPHSLTACEIREGASTSFAKLWDCVHGAGSFDANPEVVVLTFAVVPINIDSLAAYQRAFDAAFGTATTDTRGEAGHD